MTTGVYTLQDFVRELQDIRNRDLSEQESMELIADPLGRIISREDCLADFEGNDDPDPESGFTVYRSENLTVLAVVWQPDRGAPVHNHNGWAMEGVISGVEFNHNFERLDDGREPWRAKLEEVEPSEVRAGEIMSLKLPPNDIHSVDIRAGKTRAIHVYGNDLLTQWRYRFDIESGEVTPFRLGMRGLARR